MLREAITIPSHRNHTIGGDEPGIDQFEGAGIWLEFAPTAQVKCGIEALDIGGFSCLSLIQTVIEAESAFFREDVARVKRFAVVPLLPTHENYFHVDRNP